MDHFVIVILLFIGTIILSNIFSILSSVPLVNEVAQARVRIEGYDSNGTDGIVLCKTSLGSVVHLIDVDKKMQRECIMYGGKNVRIQFKVGLSFGIITQVRIYIVGLDP